MNIDPVWYYPILSGGLLCIALALFFAGPWAERKAVELRAELDRIKAQQKFNL